MQKRRTKRLRQEAVSIASEITYIVGRATERDSRVVTLGQLIFFSTETGDAWMLDTEDGLAACLSKDCVPQPVRVLESAERMAVEWTASYAIEDEAFIVHENAGRCRTVLGYPTKAIQDATMRLKSGQDGEK